MSAGLGIGVGAPGLNKPDPTPGAVAWLRVVDRRQFGDGRHTSVHVITARWDGYTAADIRKCRLANLREARAELTVTAESIVYRALGRVETLTFHDVDPGEVVIG